MKKLISLMIISIFGTTAFATDFVTIVKKSNSVNYLVGDGEEEVLPPTPTHVVFKDIAAGESHAYAVDTEGRVWSVGRNGQGELGTGSKTNSSEWKKTSLTGVSDISANGFSGYAIKDGEIWAVGRNSNGELGIGTLTDQTKWTATGKKGFKKVIGGIHHAYAIDNAGNVWSAGHNNYGQLGIGSGGASVTTWRQSNMKNAVDVDSGYYFGVALKSDGTVWTVGRNDVGQLGLGVLGSIEASWTNISDDNPLLTNVTDVGAGWFHSQVLSGGVVYSTGLNAYGELGVSDTTMRTSFVASNLTDVVSVEGGREHSYAIKSNGDVYSTGNNVKGQLGTGDVTRYDSWVKSTMKGAEKISSDARFGLSLKDGKVWFTGENAYGISGDGSSANVSIWREIKEIPLEEDVE